MCETVGRPMEILLVEDDLVHARLAIESVQRCEFRHRTTLTLDGREALDFLLKRGVYRRALRPDLILLELRLPGMDVLAEIKGSGTLTSIPVVVMTGSDEQQDRLACAAHRVEANLAKPVDLDKFFSLLGQLKRYFHRDMVLPLAHTQNQAHN